MICNDLQEFAMICNDLQWFALICNGLQWFAMICKLVICSDLQWWFVSEMWVVSMICNDLRGFAMICNDLQGFAIIYNGLQWFAELHSRCELHQWFAMMICERDVSCINDLQWFTRICNDLQGFARVCRVTFEMLVASMICNDLQGFARICNDLQWFCNNLQWFGFGPWSGIRFHSLRVEIFGWMVARGLQSWGLRWATKGLWAYEFFISARFACSGRRELFGLGWVWFRECVQVLPD
jgi:hypothetical protein